MNKILAGSILLVCMLFPYFSSGVQAKPLQLVTLEQPPIAFRQNGELNGIAVDILKEIFFRLQIPVELEAYPFARALHRMETGKADILFAVVKTREREIYMNYPDEILIEQKASLFVRSDSEISFNGDLTTLSKYTFGILRKATYGIKWKTAVDSGVINKIEPVTDYRQNLNKLVSNRVDILIGPRFTMLYLINELGFKNEIKEISPEIESVPTYFTFSKTNLPVELQQEIEQTLVELKQEGRVEDIINSYLGL